MDVGQVFRLYGMGVSFSRKIKTNTASVLGRSSMVQYKMYLGRILNEQKIDIRIYCCATDELYVHQKLIL
jgi:hypothetical protein